MYAAIVTGASSGIGLSVSRMLCGLGYEVFGIGRDFGRDGKADEDGFKGRFHPIVCDLLDTPALLNVVKQISADYPVYVLVNNAGSAYYGLHEELNPQKIQQMVRTNLEVPMILTQQLLRVLKKNSGFIINIASVTAAGVNPHGCAYGATKAGLSSFAHSLFEEARKYGVKVAAIYPDMTKTNLYRNADFKEGDDEMSYLLPGEVAQAVRYVLSQREGLAVTDITLRPQLHRIQRKPPDSL
ncbi:MAG: SDR family oxidoreductase [Eubacterium sp.]|jgi:short-subunit dehydrogenase|nr:SDR family oxidoreductase [Eubacterium sp.]NBI85907.1 SDR family oxidoreductase [Lachnospiraceae bacterium]